MPETLKSWNDYVDMLKPAGELAKITWEPESDQLRAELYRQLVMNISLGYFMYFQSTPDHPDFTPFLNSVFVLQPNPDDVYYYAPLRGDGVYRVTGDRGTVRLLIFTMGARMMGTSDMPGEPLGEYDADTLDIGPNGRLEIIFSTERPAGHGGNWIRLDPKATHMVVRQRSYDWGAERDARLAIECLNAPSLKPALTKEEIAEKTRELLGGFTRRLSEMWIKHNRRLRERNQKNQFEFFPFRGGVQLQVYWEAEFQFSTGEALILETDMPKTHRYWGIQLNDPLFNTIEYVYRQSSLNGHQARLDSDGKFRAVLSVQDPGVPNWLDTGGYLQGSAIGRWYDSSSHPLPTLKRVPLSKLGEYLPADTPRVSAAEREAVLRERRTGAQLRRRW